MKKNNTSWISIGTVLGDTNIDTFYFSLKKYNAKKGDIVTNPQTGMKIELPGELIGKVKITQTVGTNINDEICFAKSVGNEINVSDFKNYYVEEISNNK